MVRKNCASQIIPAVRYVIIPGSHTRETHVFIDSYRKTGEWIVELICSRPLLVWAINNQNMGCCVDTFK